MSKPSMLDQVVRVSPRFARSVSLVRDADRRDALRGYILTPTGREVLRRITHALRGESSTRAWSITGPYGTGKSALANFLAQLLAGEQGVRKQARFFLAAEDKELADRLFGPGAPLARRIGRLCPVLVTGSREPLQKALLAGLAVALRCHSARQATADFREAGMPSGAAIPRTRKSWEYLRKRTSTWPNSVRSARVSC